MSRPQVLFLDAYDSFTNNIVSLLTTLLHADVHVLPIDNPSLDQNSPDFERLLRLELAQYHAVVCGPGPGSPEIDRDVGLMRQIWSLNEDDLLPVLGVCLGFQSLVVASGGKVRRLRRGLHGMVRDIEHQKPPTAPWSLKRGDIFHGVDAFKATIYHSLCADVGQDVLSEDEWRVKKWEAPSDTPDLLPLAWTLEDREDGTERILMAVKHRTKPFWGLQYHPESICTEVEGHAAIRNWFREALRWNVEAGRKVVTGESSLARNATRASLLSEVRLLRDTTAATGSAKGAPWTESMSPVAAVGLDCGYTHRTIPLPAHIKIPDVVEILRREASSEHIILDSANADKMATGAADVRGRYSIIALDVAEALRIEYHVGDDFATARIPAIQGVAVDLKETIPFTYHQNIWQLLADFLEKRQLTESIPVESPFKGGFMGYITYEMGLQGMDVEVGDRGHRRPDLCFAWVTKSIVMDHLRNVVHVQHLQKKKLIHDFWVDSIVESLQTSDLWRDTNHDLNGLSTNGGIETSRAVITTPMAHEYEEKVRQCQDYIAAGESYELCLTDQTTITLPAAMTGAPAMRCHPRAANGQTQPCTKPPTSDTAWNLYRTLRTRQPAPFGSFLRLGGATIVSSSPERFLEYSCGGLCSMRPMKGTVRKSPAVSTLAQAEEILHVPKEEAENLMIVDLVRHDLHGVCGSGNVTVPHLMKVEEYASVFQMITVVNGQLPEPEKQGHGGARGEWYTGLDVLAASLPPGSMTGAPKKRSCELLQEIEGLKERSIYSGVVGYMDVTGKGDWSVTIRTMFRWDDEVAAPGEGESEGTEVWHIGAGGAVTILSTPEGEREEMFTKLTGPLGVFSSGS
ncbi:aminodeoxychorismate synthase [Sodiomyces alkalinus F11]|uniref:aminodeoxychorismate synthase n=1 Tax=Sodiomyces alkalinus (strain CBS 110278 / VKM F-3762 / F11) TaxID=1314773 RepID=A0A3N2PX50_SODAK|nr:aminodeoxychorismate synthase [Sodiomyces alkalinus F11]ROT39109.1 aminodeoxychorismate synthase [Sodiomyces alkalinus F11]